MRFSSSKILKHTSMLLLLIIIPPYVVFAKKDTNTWRHIHTYIFGRFHTHRLCLTLFHMEFIRVHFCIYNFDHPMFCVNRVYVTGTGAQHTTIKNNNLQNRTWFMTKKPHLRNGITTFNFNTHFHLPLDSPPNPPMFSRLLCKRDKHISPFIGSADTVNRIKRSPTEYRSNFLV